MRQSEDCAAYSTFNRGEWAGLRASTPLTLSESDLVALRGLNEPTALHEVEDIYLPLSRLLNLHIAAARNLGSVRDAFLGRPASSPPYIVALAGSPAVGKSTLARVLRTLLARWPDHPRVELVATDGFLHPTSVLEERKLMHRKGFPESYDVRNIVRFLAAVKAGQHEVATPVYSHHTYDIVPGEFHIVRQPDVLIFEGLNVLQAGHTTPTMISDFFDFSISTSTQTKATLRDGTLSAFSFYSGRPFKSQPRTSITSEIFQPPRRARPPVEYGARSTS